MWQDKTADREVSQYWILSNNFIECCNTSSACVIELQIKDSSTCLVLSSFVYKTVVCHFPKWLKGLCHEEIIKGCRRNLCSNSFFCSLTTFKGNFVKVGHRTVTGKETLVEYFREVRTNNLKNICESCYLRVVCDGFILATWRERQKTAGVRAEWSDSVIIWPYLGNWAAGAFVKRRPVLSLNHPDICYWKRSIRGSCVLFAESRESKTARRQRQW